ncbi:hypothetical protein BDP27DRAFT_1345067 [Rhodocollybia butyracea]|uniref:Transcription initiation factor TFIID subunit 4 n=1 Tax=Rhodocollybia butyracea TaxID=206335 RepID=A0A9P5P707_9AGAR|nr:hypothetical protein BDP27DRAFT_1345067 [Rhodocollybia butyracea]
MNNPYSSITTPISRHTQLSCTSFTRYTTRLDHRDDHSSYTSYRHPIRWTTFNVRRYYNWRRIQRPKLQCGVLQLKVLEPIEQNEELKIRWERKERTDMAPAALTQSSLNNPSSDGGFDDDDSSANGGTKKKRKRYGPGVDVQKKMSNIAASHAAGLTGLTGRSSWMTAAASTTLAPGTPTTPTPDVWFYHVWCYGYFNYDPWCCFEHNLTAGPSVLHQTRDGGD